METALFATDFSEYADHALEVLPHLKAAGLRRVVLEHALDEWQFVNWPMAGQQISAEIRDRAREALAERLSRVQAMGLEAVARLDSGVPFREIITASQAAGADLIVMGAQGKSVLRELVLGSVSENVVRHAGVPVLLQRFPLPAKEGDEREFTVRPPFTRILHPTDFSDTSHKALQFLLDNVRGVGAEVMLLHVQDERRIKPYMQDMLPDFDRIDSERLEEMSARLREAEITPQIRLVTGTPFLEIERAAAEWDATLIALGSHGRSALAEVMMGSVSSQVVRMLDRSVLVVRR